MPYRWVACWAACWLLAGLACQPQRALPHLWQQSATSEQARVLIFLDTDCPISRQMTLYIRQLAAHYDPQTVAIQIVFQHHATRAQIRDFLASFELSLPYVVNTRYALSRQTGASITPEFLLYDARQNLRYCGAINDLYSEIGIKRPQPTQFFLQANIDSLLRDKPLPFSAQKAVGCLIE